MVVSVVHIQKVRCVATENFDSSLISLAATHPTLDGKSVSKISAFLFHAGGNADPKVLLANANKSFQGSIVLGMGFTFDDSNPETTTIAEMHRLIAESPKNQERIFPYIGGEEVNSSPTHSHHRYVINFGEMSEAEAGKYPDLMRIVEDKVKPERFKQKDKGGQEKWWQFLRVRTELNQTIANCDRVLVIPCAATKYLGFVFLSSQMVFSHKLVIFPFSQFFSFAVMQSQVHEIWAIFFSSTLGDTLAYNPSDCFQTFPFPSNWETNAQLEEIGKTYYEYRAELMIRNNQGLTETYNRFHNPDEGHPDIIKLRQLHGEMDRIVLDAYGWKDIATDCNFLLDYEEEEEEEDPPLTPLKKGGVRQKKKPWRYRWPEEIHDEVLARLLELNLQRAQEEILGGKAAEGKAKGGKKTAAKSRKKVSDSPSIPGFSDSL